MNMLIRAISHGFQTEYLLTNSWFFNFDLLKLITSLHKKHNINLITMARLGTTKFKPTSNNQRSAIHNIVISPKNNQLWLV